jgi:hypothetical protein
VNYECGGDFVCDIANNKFQLSANDETDYDYYGPNYVNFDANEFVVTTDDGYNELALDVSGNFNVKTKDVKITGSNSAKLQSKDIVIDGKAITIGNGSSDFVMDNTPTINIGTPYGGGMSAYSPHIYTVAQSKSEYIGQYDLTVLGGFNINAENDGVDITGNCYATAFYETSDENLKDFSGNVDVDFAKLKEIRKSYFTWKDGNGKTQIGTSAQDVQKVYPELVSEDNKGNLTVDYAKLSIIALSAIDKLDERLSKIEKALNITE